MIVASMKDGCLPAQDTRFPREAIRANMIGMFDGSVALPRSIWHHVRTRHLELAAQLVGRTPIYLDSRFWFDLRRADEGQSGARAAPLLRALRDATRQGRIFCPISSSTFVELLKHADPAVRIKSAQLADELSMGVAVVDPERLAQTELEWLVTNPGDRAPDPTVVPVWTKVASSLGTVVPHNPDIPPRAMLALQVATFDEVWSSSLTEFVTHVDKVPDLDGSEMAQRMTEGIRAHAHEVTDFKTVYESEVTGSADLYEHMFSEIMRRKAADAGEISSESTAELLRQYRNLIAAVQLSGNAQQALRSFHIRASLYSIIRLNKGHRFKSNDTYDIEHAIAGVGYAKAFFSEGSLVTALKQNPLRLDKLYGCFVTNDVEDAIKFTIGV